MNCRDAEQFFDAYLDGELDGSLRLEFDAHRLRCRDCQRQLAMLESFEHIIAGDRRGPTLSDDFTDRVLGEIDRRGIRPARVLLSRRFVVPAAALLPAAAVLLLTFAWPVSHTSLPGSLAPPRDESGFVVLDPAELDTAMQDPIRLHDLILGEAERFWAARGNLASEASAIPSYVMNLLPHDVANTPIVSPLDALRGLFAPGVPPIQAPEPTSADEFSL